MRLRARTFFLAVLGCLFVDIVSPVCAQIVWKDTPSWHRVLPEPVISPSGASWQSTGTFNPGVIRQGNKIVMLYRAQDAKGTSQLGYASSDDGVHFTARAEPVLSPEASYEENGGVEDPRLIKIGKTFYLTYTGYNKKDAQLCLATSRDLVHWTRKGILLPAYQGNWNKRWTKSGAILTKKIHGKYWMYWLGTSSAGVDEMGLSSSKDLVHWTEATTAPVLAGRPGQFDARVVEPGPPPFMTDQGIVLIYNGADEHLVYRTGIAIFDRKDPSKLLWRTSQPVFSPEQSWEKTGQVPNVVFVEGIIAQPERLLLYYGGADKYVGVAEAITPLGR